MARRVACRKLHLTEVRAEGASFRDTKLDRTFLQQAWLQRAAFGAPVS